MKNKALLTAIIPAILLLSACTSLPKDDDKKALLPETAFHMWCAAFTQDDFQTAYDLLSSRSKEGHRKDYGVNNAHDYEKHVRKAIPEYKNIFKEAEIHMRIYSSKKALGHARLNDKKPYEVHFVRENGEWRIDYIGEISLAP